MPLNRWKDLLGESGVRDESRIVNGRLRLPRQQGGLRQADKQGWRGLRAWAWTSQGGKLEPKDSVTQGWGGWFNGAGLKQASHRSVTCVSNLVYGCVKLREERRRLRQQDNLEDGGWRTEDGD